ncbi:hypothetical protein [Rhodopirellula europaea]|uniref:hypothetical protein n=1 Tax=Rhodopirellula europaea TaxID=1263866 RepID=UPI003D28F47C|tara:strand:- start:5436 stop:6530 length:1095 start_codon:yes stop_codon:yes gene_type:complete
MIGRLAGAVAVVLVLQGTPVFCQDSAEAAKAIGDWKSWCDNLESYDCRVNFRKYITGDETPRHLAREAEARCRYQSGMWRMDVLYETRYTVDGDATEVSAPESGRVYAFDGEVLRFLNVKGEFGEESSPRKITPHRLCGPMPFEAVASNFNGVPWVLAFSGRLESASVFRDSEKLGPGTFAVRVRPCVDCGMVLAKNVTATAVFSEGRPGAPVMIELSRSRPISKTECKFGAGFLPSEYRHLVYDLGESSKLYVANEMVAVVSQEEINTRIPVEVFRSVFPEGTKVFDSSAQRVFLSDPEAAGGKNYRAYEKKRIEEELHRKSFSEHAVPAQAINGRLYFVVFSLVFALIGIIFMWRRSGNGSE